jgi:hypothetical protein
MLRDKRGWTVLPLDLGDIPQMKGPASLLNVQGLVKYRYTMHALKQMGYLAVSFGEYEAAQPLTDAMDEYALNYPEPAVLAANLLKKDEFFPDPGRRTKSYVDSWETVTVKPGLKVGVVASIGPSVALKIKDPKGTFAPGNQAIPQALREMQAAQVDFRVLLYQGSLEEAKTCARMEKEFQVILCLSEEDEPPSRAEVVGQTFVIRVGHKCKNVGIVGVNRTNNPQQPFTLRYQMVSLGGEYQTPADKEASHPILRLLEQYTRELKSENYLARYRKIPHSVQFACQELQKFKGAAVEYAGSEACQQCHAHAFTIWKASAHSSAYKTLVNAKRPGLRQFDGECIVCHTIGFAYKGGFTDAVRTAHLENVGCESCHGPCNLHVRNPTDKKLYPLINPLKAKAGETPKTREKRLLAIEQTCQKCHDQDNDVHWTFDKWEKKHIIHMTPQE